MKKLILVITFLAVTCISYSQTNTFPLSGNVGIGTTSPIAPLHIYDGGTNYNNSEILSLQTSYNSNSAIKALTWRDPTAITGQIATYFDGTHVNMSFGHLYNSGYQTNDLMTIMGNGNVGIGTASPSAAFQIVRGGTNSGTDYASMQITSRGSGSIYGPIVYLNGTSGTGGRMWGVVSSGALDASVTGAAGNFAIYDGTVGTSRLVINSSGNVGIGTINPGSYRLAVNGGIHSQSVNVDLTDWSDYVFKKEYQLPTLNQVKTYIDKNHHLPDMPSEQEVIKEGINLGEMNKLLTKKVEELTLYLIQQKEENDKQLRAQQKQIDELKQLLSSSKQSK